MQLLTPPERNSNTACRNSAAPSAAIVAAPPARSSSKTMHEAAQRTSERPADTAPGVAGKRSAGRSVRARTINAQNITSMLCSGVCAAATIARWRTYRARSRYRAAAPCSQYRMHCRDTPASAPAALRDEPPWTLARAPKMFGTLLTLPGSTSQGSTRSRAPQASHRASTTATCW
jgi:hypothetical protein